MEADPNIGFNYMPGWTMSGILYNGEHGAPRISRRIGGDGFPLFSSRIGETGTTLLPINICSSSDGLVASHNPISNIYYVWNPERLDSYVALPQPPRQHDAFNTHVVLAVQLSVVHVYHLICAVIVEEYPIRYAFDTYTSAAGEWLSCEGIDVGGLILPNTGISCGMFAYWLTEYPWSVIRFDAYNPHVRWRRFPVNVDNVGLGTQFQLGRVSEKLGLVSVDNSWNPRITLYLLQKEGFPVPWKKYTFVLQILNPDMLPLRPIRFESCKFEVFFCANGKLMIWESSIVEPQRHRVGWLNAVGAPAAVGFPLISSQYLPSSFPISSVNLHSVLDGDES